jgi:hypothetical protein
LTVDQAATLNITLQVGDVTQVVTVTADAELINTTTAEIGTTVGQEAVTELPLNGRHTSDLVFLSAGVINVLNTGGGKFQGETTMPDATGASAGGGRQGSTFYMLDGSPNMDTYMSLAASFPPPDATQEFRVITNNYDAHYGFAPGAIVTIQTRTGTNQFHGAAYDFGRNQLANASDYFGTHVDGLHRNIFGGSFGGPVFKNKLFFFANFEHQHNGSQGNNNFANFPTARMMGITTPGVGDFSEFTPPASGTYTTCTPINGPDNKFTFNTTTGCNSQTTTLDAKALLLLANALPVGTPNVGGNNPGYTEYSGAPGVETYKYLTTRIDYNINDNQRLFLRSFTEIYKNNGSAIPGNWIAVTPTKTGEFYSEALGHTWTINDRTVNTLNVYYTQMDVLNGQESLDKTGKPVCLSEYINVTEKPGHCYMMGSGASGGNKGFWSNWAEPTGERRYTYGLGDAFTKTIKNQTLSAGTDIVHIFAQENTDYPATVNAQAGGNWTGNGFADFISGNWDSFTQGGGEISSVKGWMLGIYAQDQYKIKPNLTVTLGIRWDPNTPPTVTGGRGSGFVPGEQSVIFPNAPLGMIFPGDKGLDDKLMPTSYNNWDPRIGIAYQPKALPKTSFHTGFGLFTGPLQYSSYNHTSDIAPFSPTFGFSSIVSSTPANNIRIPFDNPWTAYYPNAGGTPAHLAGQTLFASTATAPGGNQFGNNNFASLNYKPPTNSPIITPVSLQAEFDPHFKRGTTISWNFSVEQQLTPTMAIHAAYVGSQSYDQSVIVDENDALPGLSRPYSNYNQILVNKSMGTSPYNALQAGFDKRISHGLTVQSNFTWSKVEDLASSGNISFVGALDNPNIGWDRGISDENEPFVWTTNFVYKTPTPKSLNPVARAILGNYELSGIWNAQSGHPVTIYGGWCAQGGWDNCSQTSGEAGDRADFVPGQKFWILSKGPHSAWGTNGPGYFNAAAVTHNAAYTYGNTPKNFFRGPGQQYFDSALSKHIKVVRDQYDLQLRFEFFNTFNHPSFGSPNNYAGNGGFGQITGGGNVGARVAQGSVKFNF